MFRSDKQREFAQCIRAHINAPDAPLLLEGGTGLGKTRAYLHPLFESGKKVAICLATNELVNQL